MTIYFVIEFEFIVKLVLLKQYYFSVTFTYKLMY